MSTLHDKINSYAIERGIEMDETFSTNPTRTGSSTPISNAYFVNNTSYPPVYESGVGPVGGSGSWKFRFNAAPSTNSRISMTTVNTPLELPGLSDNDWSIGLWMKFDKYPAIASMSFLAIGNSSSSGVTIFYAGSTNTTVANRGKFSIGTAGGLTTTFSSVAITDTNWHYVAVTRTTSPSIMYYLYIDGAQVASASGTSTTAATTFGLGSASTQNDNYNINFSNYYFASSSVIGPTQIAEIWTVGSTGSSGTDVSITETPATASALSVDASVTGSVSITDTPAIASALITEPTIATTIGDNSYITTSILVNASMGSASVSATANLNITISETLDASVQLINNVVISTGYDESFSASEFTATAQIVQPFVAQSPMTANAQFGNHTVYVDPNYFNEVKKLNPYLYINSGSKTNTPNYGYQSGTFSYGAQLLGNVDGGYPLNTINNGFSWQGATTSNAANTIIFTTPTSAESFEQLVGTGNFAYEAWIKPRSLSDPSGTTDQPPGPWLISATGLDVYMDDFYAILNPSTGWQYYPRTLNLRVFNGTANTTISVNLDSTPVTIGKWQHFVVNVYQSGINANQRLVQLWIDGNIIINQTISFTTYTSNNNSDVIAGKTSVSTGQAFNSHIDEIAIYSQPLTNTQIINHYEMIGLLSPNVQFFAETFNANIDTEDHSFTVTSNAIPEIKEATASILMVEPDVQGGKSVTAIANAAIASALATETLISYGINISVDEFVAYAESANAFALNTIYFDYIQSAIAPYRYVSFDSSTPYVDYGTDNDYSVISTSGGTIVNPEFGINGKSAKINGITYTDGVVLKESEWNDTWGTGQNTYHSSFWMQKADDDVSTGLRVLWNLNGYLDNQHVILFQYQGKLHMQFNNGSGTHVDSVTTNNIDLFDGQRHFVVVTFDHTNNNNNTVHLYVDSVLVLTVSLGSYNGQTVNGTSYVGPNDEANNHPRLGIGCLITPFANTALPVVPTNIKIYVDEIVWAKSAANQTLINNLYNIMPDKANSTSAADPMTTTALIVAPVLSTEQRLAADDMTASAEIIDVEVYAEYQIIFAATTLTAQATFLDAQRSDGVIISADVAIASASTADGTVRITISGTTMTANASFPDNIYFNDIPIRNVASPYLRYLRTQSLSTTIMSMREVK